jgi:hypothetical protein
MYDADIVKLISKYLEPLLQIISVKVPYYNMKMKVTKCANTAALLVFLLAGEKRFKNILVCDVGSVKERMESHQESKTVVVRNLRKDVLSLRHNEPYLYYVLLTTDHFECAVNTKRPQPEQRFFPGHVFLIEKRPYVVDNQKHNLYRYYQSYIKQYTLEEHLKKNRNTFRVKETKMAKFLDGLVYMMDNDTWDSNTNSFWKQLTFVNGQEFDACQTAGLYPCYTKLKLSDTYITMMQFIKKTIRELKKDIKTNDVAKYHVEVDEGNLHAGRIHTVPELLTAMNSLLRDLSSAYNIIR